MLTSKLPHIESQHSMSIVLVYYGFMSNTWITWPIHHSPFVSAFA